MSSPIFQLSRWWWWSNGKNVATVNLLSLSLLSVAQQKNGAAEVKKGFEEEDENQEEGAGRGCGEVEDGERGGGQGEDASRQLDCDQVQLVRRKSYDFFLTKTKFHITTISSRNKNVILSHRSWIYMTSSTFIFLMEKSLWKSSWR